MDNSIMNSESEEGYDSEAELQEAYAQGILKPGINIQETIKEFKVDELYTKLSSFYLDLPWIERLDLDSKQAPLAPELAAKLEEENDKQKSGKISDPVLDDFKRELIFHRQAQSAVLEGLSRLKTMGIVTKRPEDYYAEMAKSDSHMQKVRATLLKKQNAVERAEKVRSMRKFRKVSKELQKQARVQKEKEKREFLDQVKKYKQKMTTDLSFLDAKPKPKVKVPHDKVKKTLNRRAERKRKLKDKTYGMGGRKKGSKHNTKESSANLGRQSGKRNVQNKRKPAQRPGKSKRAKQKGGKKR